MTTCRYSGPGTPRLTTQHLDDCPGDCKGCAPCRHNHCTRCGREHVDQLTCPGCIADARADLDEIRRMTGALPGEAAAKGIDSEAFNLLGPVPDPEAHAHVEASYLAGRLPEGWLDTGRHGKDCPTLANEACTGCGGTEWHPLTVLATWQDVYADAMGHTLTLRATVEDAADYLDRNLAYVAQLSDVPFVDLARDLSACRRHMEAVLHDGEQVETGAPCMTCRKPLVRVWGADEKADGWKCPQCRERVSEAQYRFSLAQDLADAEAERWRDKAPEWATADEIQRHLGIKPSALSMRARRGALRSRIDTGRTVYRVADLNTQPAEGA